VGIIALTEYISFQCINQYQRKILRTGLFGCYYNIIQCWPTDTKVYFKLSAIISELSKLNFSTGWKIKFNGWKSDKFSEISTVLFWFGSSIFILYPLIYRVFKKWANPPSWFRHDNNAKFENILGVQTLHSQKLLRSITILILHKLETTGALGDTPCISWPSCWKHKQWGSSFLEHAVYNWQICLPAWVAMNPTTFPQQSAA